MEWDRTEMLDYGRSRGYYVPTRRSLLVDDPAVPRVRMGGRCVPVARLDDGERRRLLVATAEGEWQPAMVWLNLIRRNQDPMTGSSRSRTANPAVARSSSMAAWTSRCVASSDR